MLQLTVIGHLGADAEVKNSNGNDFVSFRVAHSETFTDSTGTRKERTQWVSCALNGNGGALLPYLKKGTQVCVVGNMTLGITSSQIQRAMVATCNLHVRTIELIGGQPSNDLPRQLADETGALFPVLKFFSVDTDTWQRLAVTEDGKFLYDARGGRYFIDKNAIITRLTDAPEPSPETPENNG